MASQMRRFLRIQSWRKAATLAIESGAFGLTRVPLDAAYAFDFSILHTNEEQIVLSPRAACALAVSVSMACMTLHLPPSRS
jgi:K+ transporter